MEENGGCRRSDQMLAIKIGSAPGASVALKQWLAENIPSYPLFSTAAIARNLEAAYLGMIENSRSAPMRNA